MKLLEWETEKDKFIDLFKLGHYGGLRCGFCLPVYRAKTRASSVCLIIFIEGILCVVMEFPLFSLNKLE